MNDHQVNNNHLSKLKNTINNQLIQRKNHQWLTREVDKNAGTKFLFSPNDIGVQRNGGKRGSKHGPLAILACLQRMITPEEFSWDKNIVTPQLESLEQFDLIQEQSYQMIKQILIEDFLWEKNIVHLGGGHDHVFPLLRALLELKINEPLIIINIDAHLDTRNDEMPHSGTPFRQLQNIFPDKFELFQIGIHPFANQNDNFKKMKNMRVINYGKDFIPWLNENLKPYRDKKCPLFLSIDCDGLDGSIMPAVSAPNHTGLQKIEIEKLINLCIDYWKMTNSPRLAGLYEFNPIYDNLSQISARYISYLIHKMVVL